MASFVYLKIDRSAHSISFISMGSPLIDGIFLVQKMCIYSCVTLSTTLLMRAVPFNARSACDASMFTSGLHTGFTSCILGLHMTSFRVIGRHLG